MSVLHRSWTGLLSGLALASTVGAQQQGWSETIPRSLLYDEYRQAEIYSVDFLDRHVGWAVGGHSNVTIVFRTEDGGRSWERLPLFDGEQHVPAFSAIRFADVYNGWMVGDRHVLRTTDGGESWEPVEVPSWSAGLAANALLVLAPDAVMIGSNSSSGSQIRVTTDGGRSWRVSTVSEDGNDDVVGLAVAEPETFFAVTASAYLNRGGIHRSRDGGRSWEAVVEGDKPLRTIAFSGSHGVAAGDGVAYWTDDGGETWRRTIMPGSRYAVEFVDGDHVVGLGTDPVLVLSEDGGRSWRDTGTALRGRLVDIAVIDMGWWFAAGGYGANALFHYADPDYLAPVAGGSVSLPDAVTAPGGERLPPGLYDVTLGHRGDAHTLDLFLVEPMDHVTIGVHRDSVEADRFTCDPCGASFPVDVEYGTEAFAPEETGGGLRLSLEPTTTGIALVLDVATTLPRSLAAAAAALDVAPEQEVTVSESAERAGGLFGRMRRAASGDVRGALEGAPNPAAAAERVRASNAAPPAVYRIRLRLPLDLIPEVGSR